MLILATGGRIAGGLRLGLLSRPKAHWFTSIGSVLSVCSKLTRGALFVDAHYGAGRPKPGCRKEPIILNSIIDLVQEGRRAPFLCAV